MAIGLITAAGAGLTHIFPTAVADGVSRAETTQRADAFTRVAPLALPAIEPARVDAALLEMRLDPAQREALQRALAAPSSAGAAATTLAPVPAAVSDSRPLRLVELVLWDTHAPDGDTVRVASAGYQREVVISKTAQTIAIPVADGALLQITGVRDGGGGITLGVRGPQQEVLMPILSEGQTLALPVRP